MALVLPGCATAVNPAAIEDAQIAVRVKTALVNDPQIGTRTIEVRVVGGVVRLSGRVLTDAEAQRAVDLARAVSGVRDVQPSFQIGEVAPEPAPDAAPGDGQTFESAEFEPTPRFLAIGGAVGWSRPRGEGVESRLAISPLFKLGSGRGLGPAITFDWFQANVRSLAGTSPTLARVRVRPVMVGVSYTVGSDRLSLAPSIVAGLAFNSLTITRTGAADGLPVEVGNSWALRPGLSVWSDLGRRVALYVSTGYLVTTLPMTVLDAGRLEKRDRDGNTLTVHLGVAYRLF